MLNLSAHVTLLALQTPAVQQRLFGLLRAANSRMQRVQARPTGREMVVYQSLWTGGTASDVAAMSSNVEEGARGLVKILQSQGHMCSAPASARLVIQCPTSLGDLEPSVATAFMFRSDLGGEDRDLLEAEGWGTLNNGTLYLR